MAPKHAGASRQRTEVNKCHTSQRARNITVLYPVGMATIATLEDKERRRVQAIGCHYTLFLKVARSRGVWSS